MPITLQKRSTLLICCKGGEVIEYVSPDEGTFDTSKTFEITGLSNRIHKFKSIKSRLRVSRLSSFQKFYMVK